MVHFIQLLINSNAHFHILQGCCFSSALYMNCKSDAQLYMKKPPCDICDDDDDDDMIWYEGDDMLMMICLCHGYDVMMLIMICYHYDLDDTMMMTSRVAYHIKSIRSYRHHKADISILIKMTDERWYDDDIIMITMIMMIWRSCMIMKMIYDDRDKIW